MVKSAVFEKCRQIGSYFQHSTTPYALTLDSLRLKRSPFIASSKSGLRLALMPSTGEGFTFYENVIRKDYLQRGITLNSGDTVIDIGANFGSFAVTASKIVGPQGRVIAFEPVTDTFARLEKNVLLNGLVNVNCIKAAVDSREGTILLQIPAKSALALARYNREEIDKNQPIETAKCVTLESVFSDYSIERINLLKVDCEGSEHGIFETLSPDIASRIDQIAMEAHDIPGKSLKQLKDNLLRLGFSVNPGYPWVAFRI